MRELLQSTGLPYVIENVVGSPLESPIVLCGSMFDLRVRRHRLFESNLELFAMRCLHRRQSERYGKTIAVYGDHPQSPGDKPYRVNRARSLAEGQESMGIDWMPWKPLTQSIPPAYTEFIGKQLLQAIQREAP